MKYVFIFLSLVTTLLSQAQVADSARREVRLQGAVNFRDIGGYETKDGKHVKWGKLYRSAAINRLTEEDLSLLKKLAISRVVDFRGPYEVSAAPDRIPTRATRISLPAGSETIGDSASTRNMMLAAMRGDSAMIAFYQNLSPFQARYKPLFQQLFALAPDSALVFHCTAGKDRTGIAAAFILYALGVDEKTIMDDYLATNYYRQRENRAAVSAMVKTYGTTESAAKQLMSAKAVYLKATFDAIKGKYGSVENFLDKEMGLDENTLKKLRLKFLD